MDLSLLVESLWAASFAWNAALLAVLLYRRRWKTFPFFTTWMSFQVLLTVALFVIYRVATVHLYAIVYWSATAVDFALQLGVVFEIARIVLRPTGTWVRDARSRFLIGFLLGLLFAAGIALAIHPSSPSSLGVWAVRGNLFTSLVICEAYLAMLFSSNRLGLRWQNHVMGLGQGLSLWAAVASLVDVAHSILGRTLYYQAINNVQSCAWIIATTVWIIVFWKPEPERLPLSPAMQKYLIDLHHRVRYDLQKTVQH